MTHYWCHCIRRESDLVFAEGVDEAGVDVVDGDPENHNNDILGHGFREGIWVPTNQCHVDR